MLRSKQTNEAIELIKSGKIDTVNVGCAVRRTRCSICGRDTKYCDHIKGRYYLHSKCKCYDILEEPTEAYEFSILIK